ncbi:MULTISPECIES: serine/threonine-protein kinase [unclassified Streptomyces]|uniref:serine/threonine-protein kinase n=1 Tax=unclassified Streptomyces TaxID=2593676 RepID=UPI000DABE3AD|nr:MULTISPECIES: serine/threonine-protein kinase [unclassified Streptomyces]PZT76663.1 serine/threonine protein kinase [Streptomyces sp. AC1-42W]PZT79381.1 serine/threonine protein kinase [Streptomyces sp. AC1-42T]
MEPLTDDDPREIGGFTLVCRIGSGGMGQVYLGESAAGHQAAVKVIRSSVLDEDTRARFMSEVESLRTVYGPFVAAFVGADAAAERPWLAVEYVPGPDLRTLVAARGPLPLTEAASLGALLAEGLGTVHEAGLLHRDLKPQNILLSRYGPKVIDFGLAVLAERRTTLTATGFVVGSVLCMPPEQARGEQRLDRSADVYALGAVLLFAVTGHYPYDGPTWQAVALKIEDRATHPDLTGAPPELVPLITDMLASDPAARPALPEVTDRLVGVIRALGLTALQAKRRLTDLTPEISVPQLPAPAPAPGTDRPAYTPTVIDQAAVEDDEHPGPPAAPGTADPTTTGEATEEDLTADEPPAPEGHPRRPPGRGAAPRPAAPLRIAERMRAAYAREARF